MPRKATNIYKRKDGRWEGRYIRSHENGKALYGSVYAKTYGEVKRKLDAAKEAMGKEALRKKAGTVSTVGKAWLTEVSALLKDSSVNKYEDLLRCYVLPEFGDCEITDITNERLMEFSNKLITKGGKNGKGLSKSTVSAVMSTMNCLRINALRHNCTVAYNTECVTLKKDTGEIRVFSIAEETKLINWLCANLDLTSLGILLCLFSGLRIGEVCALKWDNFNFAESTFLIDRTMQRIRIKGDPEKKTEVKIFRPKSDCSVRTIPIPENLMEVLKKEQIEGAFHLTGDKNEFVEPRKLQYRFKAILKKAGIECANFHATRHTFATRCVEAGFDIKCLSEILGHADVSITLNRYVHPTLNLKSQNMSRLSGLFPLNKNS